MGGKNESSARVVNQNSIGLEGRLGKKGEEFRRGKIGMI